MVTTVGACKQCGRALRKPKTGPIGKFCPDKDAAPGTTPCRRRWHAEQNRLERLDALEGRRCEHCGDLVPRERPASAKRCGRPECEGKARYAVTRDNPESLAKHRERARRAVARRREKAIAVYGSACWVCGSTDRLEFDHVDGSGKLHRLEESISAMLHRIARTGKRLEEHPIQLLCWDCHRNLKTLAERRQLPPPNDLPGLHRVLHAALTFTAGRGVIMHDAEDVT